MLQSEQAKEKAMPRAKRDKNGNIMRKNGKIVRDYRKEYDEYHKLHIPERTARNRARSDEEKRRKKAGKPKLRTDQEVDHKIPLSKGGSNGPGNTRVISRTANRKKYNK